MHNWLIDLGDETKAAPPTSMTAEEIASREQRLADVVEDARRVLLHPGVELLLVLADARHGNVVHQLVDDRVTAFGQDVKACALGQASAAILGAKVIGRSRDELTRARDELRAMLETGGPVPSAPFEGYEVLEPARDFKNRHASIMLALEATLEAIDQASQKATA